MRSNKETYDLILKKLLRKPHEIVDAHYKFNPLANMPYINEDYVRHELAWYTTMDLNISEHVGIKNNKIWQHIATKQGYVNSNYGWCIWSGSNYSQFSKAVQALKLDRNTRRSTCIYIRPEMQQHATDDVHAHDDFMCTYATQHLIRNNRLEYIVYMRSNDAWYGLRNDYMWHKHVYWQMIRCLDNVNAGAIHWNAGSLHLYERDFEKARSVVYDG